MSCGSFISPKRSKREVLLGTRIEHAAREIRKALDAAAKRGVSLSVVIGHGAGRFGHAPAKHFGARQGYTKRFGICYVNYETMQRTPKLSAKFYAEVIRHNAVGGW